MNTAMTRYKKTALKSTKFSLSSQGRSVTVAPDGSRVNAPSNSAGRGASVFAPPQCTIFNLAACTVNVPLTEISFAWKARPVAIYATHDFTLPSGYAAKQGKVVPGSEWTAVHRADGWWAVAANSSATDQWTRGVGALSVLNAITTPDFGAGVGVPPQGHGFPGAGGNYAAAPQNSAGAGGFGDDCSSGYDCGPGLDCVFGSCVGLPLPTVPPAFCGPGSTPSPNSLGCVCKDGYQDIGNGCVLIPATTGGAEASCAIGGGTWLSSSQNCVCPSGQTWSGTACEGTPDTIEAACQAGGGTWDGNSCQCAVAGQIFSNGQCGPGCFDSFGNPGDVDPATGACIATQCAPGQGRGDQTQTCMDCGINGFQADGIHCNECPPGSSISADGSVCNCNGTKTWNTDYTACVAGGGGGTVAPPVKPPPVTTCAPGMTPTSSAPGAPCTTPPPALKPAAASGGSGGVLALLAVAAVAAAALIATGGKKKKTARHARR